MTAPRPTPRAAAWLVLLTGALAVAAPGSAGAQTGPTVAVAGGTGLAAGQLVDVTGRGFAPNQGVYVMQCVQPTGALGSAEGRARACNPDQGDDHTIWKTPVAADGTFSVQLRVEPTFGDTDCRAATCGVFVRRDHMGGAADFSQDAFTPIRFAAAAAPAPAAAAPGAAPAGELARTGATATLALLGGGMLVAGAGALRAGRRTEA